MAHVSKTAFTGNLVIDVTKVKDLLFDLAPGATRQLKRTKDGIAGVLAELPVAFAQHASAVGLAPDLAERITQTSTSINALHTLLAEVEKLAEVLRESIAFHEDAREADISMIAEGVKRAAARKDPAIEAAFEKTLKYIAQSAMKAVATRRKNEAATEAEAQPGTDSGENGA